MANRPALLRQSDLTRYAKAMQAAGVAAWRIEVDPQTGRHVIIAGGDPRPPADDGWSDL
jgi:hypothetical protein